MKKSALLLLSCLFISISPLSQAASTFSVGNNVNDVDYDDRPGQGFSPSIQGTGTGTAPLSGPILLTSFFIDYVTPINAGSLYIFDSEFTGTASSLTSLTIGGAEGLLGFSSSVSSNVWSFGSGLLLSDINGIYFAYSDVSAPYHSNHSGGNAYANTSISSYCDQNCGSATNYSGATNDNEDLVFAANFSTVPEPTIMGLFATGFAFFMAAHRRKIIS